MNTAQTMHVDNLPFRLPTRAQNSHKGDFGSVGIVGGAPGMVGAALLAGRAALFSGAGRVYVGAMDERLFVDFTCPELMTTAAESLPALPEPACLVAGPGMGVSNRARRLLESALTVTHALLLDADALNLIARDAELMAALQTRSANTLITPHPGEAARLLGMQTQAIQQAREEAIQRLVELTGTTVVLKGHASLIQCPGGVIWRNNTGNAGMAAPGMGDVLTGVIAALIAQGLSMEHAAMLGVLLHGQAGDEAAAAASAPAHSLAGLTASELLPFIRRGIARMQAG
jgi:ADP-dependent NAD(P)H-hydrate dehydratase / NAD(P)H-hydrate epimerase